MEGGRREENSASSPISCFSFRSWGLSRILKHSKVDMLISSSPDMVGNEVSFACVLARYKYLCV